MAIPPPPLEVLLYSSLWLVMICVCYSIAWVTKKAGDARGDKLFCYSTCIISLLIGIFLNILLLLALLQVTGLLPSPYYPEPTFLSKLLGWPRCGGN